MSYEVDRRHVEVVIEQLQLKEAKGVTSPGARSEQSKVDEAESEEMPPVEASNYRMLIARYNYLSMDRFDIQYASKEASNRMARPHIHRWQLLKRTARYIP